MADFPHALGPMPEESLAALLDLGLDERDLARYFRLSLREVRVMLDRRATAARRLAVRPCAIGKHHLAPLETA